MEHSDIEHMAQGYPPAHIAKDSEEVIVWLATQLLATQEQRDALAAENAVVKAAFCEVVNHFDAASNERGMARDEIRAIYPLPETPATGAYLNSVRAEGVMALQTDQKEIALVNWQYDNFDALKRAALRHQDEELLTTICMLDRMEAFAAQLRAGKDGE